MEQIKRCQTDSEMSRSMTKPTKWHVHPARTQTSLGICPVWSESLLCAQWVAKDPSFLHADTEDWLDWVDAQTNWSLCLANRSFCWAQANWSLLGTPVILLILSCSSLNGLWRLQKFSQSNMCLGLSGWKMVLVNFQSLASCWFVFTAEQGPAVLAADME